MCPKQSFKLSLRFNSNKKCEHRVLKKWQQLKNTLEEVEIFMSCSIVADESPNVTNTIWLAIFVCVVNENINETEEILDIKHMRGTIFTNKVSVLRKALKYLMKTGQEILGSDTNIK